MADALDFLRKEALRKRINGVVGGNRILWQDKDLREVHDYVMSAPEQIIRAAQPVETKLRAADIDKASLAKMGIVLRSDGIGAEDNPVCIITTPRIDLAGDTNNTAAVDCTDFGKFRQVLDTHDSSKPPVALSTMPWLSGTSMLAIARFPKPGISADSDRIAAAVRAGLQRGTSIGFIPLKWSFSKDPARPLGVNFEAIKLLEWSFVAQPCNQDCRVIGSDPAQLLHRRAKSHRPASSVSRKPPKFGGWLIEYEILRRCSSRKCRAIAGRKSPERPGQPGLSI